MKEVKNPKKPLFFYYGVILLVVILLNLIAGPMLMQHQVKDVDYGTFLSMIADKNIGEVEIDNSEIIFTDKSNETTYKTGKMDDPQLVQRLYDSGAKFEQEIQQTTSPILSFLLTFVLPLIIFVGLGQYMGKKLMDQAGGKNSMMFGMGKSNAKIYVQSTEGIHFDDVAGEDEAKENLQEIVDYLHNPNKYTAIGASMPKGILLVGPPGTGKTMLAKAVAGESGVPFFSMSGSEFVEMFVGMGASKVRDLFKQAKEKAPCIVFIPRTSGALGYTMQVEQNDKYLMSKEEIENKIATFTGGRAAEEVVFHEITTGASNDIEQATKLARAMITRYGMSDSFGMVAMETVNNQYLGGDTSLACSADTQNEIDRKVIELIRTQHEKARKILSENRQKLDELSRFLYEKETITGEEFMEILNRPEQPEALSENTES